MQMLGKVYSSLVQLSDGDRLVIYKYLVLPQHPACGVMAGNQ